MLIKRKEILSSAEARAKEIEKEKESLLFYCRECGTQGSKYKVDFNNGLSSNFYNKDKRFYKCPTCNAEWEIKKFEIIWKEPLISLLTLLVTGFLITVFLIIDPTFNIFTIILFIILCLVFIGALGILINLLP